MVVLFIVFFPHARPPGTLRPLFEYEPSQVNSIEYKSEKQHYFIEPYPLPAWKGNTIHWKVRSISKEEKKTNLNFLGSPALNGMVADMIGLEYIYQIKNNFQKHEEYGLKNCPFYIQLNVQKEALPSLCLGKSNYNNTKKYLWLKDSNDIHIARSYLFNRYETDIFTKINKKLFLHDAKSVHSFSVQFHKKLALKYPLLLEKNKSTLNFVRNGTSRNQYNWLIKGRPHEIAKQSGNFYHILSSMRLAFLAEGKRPKPKREPAIVVTFYPEKDPEKDAEEKPEKPPESYMLWNSPYPKGIALMPNQEGKKDRSSHGLADSRHHWGIYRLDQMKKILLEAQKLERFIKKMRKKKARELAKQKEKAIKKEEEKKKVPVENKEPAKNENTR